MTGIKRSRLLPSIALLASIFPGIAIAQSIGLTQPSEAAVPVNVATPIRVTSVISDPGVVPTSVLLLRTSNNGSTTTIGSLHDDGLNGDLSLGDNIYSLIFNVNESEAKNLTYVVSAGFRGSLRRSLSQPFTISIYRPSSPEQMLSDLAQDLRSGDIESALKYFTVSHKNSDLLYSLSPEELELLAEGFVSATLLAIEENNRIYQVPWTTPLGKDLSLEIMLSQSPSGEWVIISW